MKANSTIASDPFAVDSIRHALVSSGEIGELLASYEIGKFPALPEMSSSGLWDAMPGYSDIPAFRIRRLRQVANMLPDRCRILDIGSGWGEIIPMVLEKPEREYVGLDFSEAMLAEVAKKYPQCRFLHGDISEISDQFDVVMALEVCEHIVAHKILAFYRNVQRLMKPGGLFIVTVPVFEDLRTMTLRCPECGHLHNRMGHVRSYSPELIKSELGLAGFTVNATSFVYAFFDNGSFGKLKRFVADLGRRALGMGGIKPLNIVVTTSIPRI
jgi:SAM-dependent methyltransferase